MVILSLKYTLFFIASFNYVNGFNKVNFNLTNEIESLASYLKERDLTIVDSDNKRILYFIVNKNGDNITQDFRRSDDAVEKQVVNKLKFITNALSSAGMYASGFGQELSFKEKVAYVDLFMKSRPQSTDYLFKELQRIKRKGVVKDSLRKMISFLEIPEYYWVQKEVYRCFIEARKKAWHQPVLYSHAWAHDANDLSFNIFQ